MPLPGYLRATLALLFSIIPAFAGPGHYTHMAESKPIVENGLEFIAATEDDWVCFNPPIGRDPVQVQLFIRNVTDKPLLFSIFDTFGIYIIDASGKRFAVQGGRDHTLRTRPVIIAPGAKYCLSRNAELYWKPDGKSRTFIYYDGTGTEATCDHLLAGNYKLSFWCRYKEKTPPKNEDAKFSRWTGDIVTNEVSFKIIDP